MACFFLHFFIEQFKLRRGRWALRAPRPAPKDFVLWTPSQRKSMGGEKKQPSLAAPGATRVRRLLAHRKPGKIPRGKLAFPWRFSPGFPRMQSIRAGRFSGRARSITAASLAVLSK